MPRPVDPKAGSIERRMFFSANRAHFAGTCASLLFAHDLSRKPVSTPDQVRAGLFGIML
jgi:hypothetical protein